MNQLSAIFPQQLNIMSPISDITKLHGDASNREYSRITLADKQTFILMQMPKGNASVSEEISSGNFTSKELPFISIARYLHSLGIRVPNTYFHDEQNDFLILEDFGDELLGHKLGDDPDAKHYWIERAIDVLVYMQEKTRHNHSSIANHRSFDETLLNWEFDHFREYVIDAREYGELSKPQLARFDTLTRQLSAEILDQPYGFTHRDFQSRNLMVLPDNSIGVLDFQDALRGPLQYDLVALLRDSYVKLAPEDCLNLQRYYYAMQAEHEIYSADISYEETLKQFHKITVQRKMKDAGRFVFFDRVKKNPDYLKFVQPSLNYVKFALSQLPEYSELFELLQPIVPEFNES